MQFPVGQWKAEKVVGDKMHKSCRNGFLSKVCTPYYQRPPEVPGSCNFHQLFCCTSLLEEQLAGSMYLVISATGSKYYTQISWSWRMGWLLRAHYGYHHAQSVMSIIDVKSDDNSAVVIFNVPSLSPQPVLIPTLLTIFTPNIIASLRDALF